MLFNKNTPRIAILFIDMVICAFSLAVAYLLRFNFNIPVDELKTFPVVFPLVLGIRLFSFFLVGTYKGIVRYTSTRDAARIFLTLLAGTFLLITVNGVNYWAVNHKFVVPFSVLFIEFLASVFFMIASRIFYKALYMEIKNPGKTKTNVVIFGAGESGIITKRTLDRDAGTKYKVLAFIDDHKDKIGKKVEGINIYPTAKLAELLAGNDIAHVIISIQNLPAAKRQEIIELCLNYDTKILNVPPVKNWINGELSFKQIKKIRIEDLLEREPIKLDLHNIQKQISGKQVLVTGAAGSIGSELVRQLTAFNPSQIILLDQAESALYDMEIETTEKLHFKKSEVVMGDIRNQERMRRLFEAFKPQVVFHAAAYKHVPMMENNPSEAVLTNVLGTKILADLSEEFGVEKFVMVSTDKAVNPTNVMGASKRIAEIYIQSKNRFSTTQYITTRFGNVLGSNGSVIPRFKQQIEQGGPITITHPEITRYFMTIPEACQLVLEAGAMGKGGEIFIFDMGKSVRIVDLAKKMVKLSGLELGKDIQLVYTGLRPGEKLYEELLNNQENTMPTHHSQIMIAKVAEYEYPKIEKQISHLIQLFDAQNNEAIVKEMKILVPEFKSNNSVYEKLDS